MIIRNHQHSVTVPIFAFFLVLLLLNEIVNFFYSVYQPNSILFLRSFFVVLGCIFVLQKLVSNKKYRNHFVVIISLLAGLMAFFNLPIFFFRYYEAGIYGFDDFTQFRFLYMPLGFFSNEWVTILFCFLPFPLIGLFLFQKKKLIRYGFLLIIGLIVFNIFISFSRAGILAFLLFIGLLNLFFYFNRILSIKKLLVGNVVIILFSIFFAFCFTESIRSSIYQTNSHQRSSEGRFKQWKNVSTLAHTYPYWGIGSKNYALVGNQSKRLDLENTFSGRLNNTYIQLIIEKGWIGLFVWLFVIGMLVSLLFRQIKKEENLKVKATNCILFSAVLAILFKEIFFSSLLYNSGILFLFFILLIFNKNESKKIQVRQWVVLVFVTLLIVGTVYFSLKKPESALSYATKGLECERSANISVPFGNLNNYSIAINKAISESILLYQKACQLSPFDAMFQHNLGWLYLINQQSDSAIFYITQAIKTDPNNAIYHISKGLITEIQRSDQAFEEYKQAILLSPDIVDSPFFTDLKERNPVKTKEILQDAYEEMLQIQSIRYSSIIEAKIGKILLALGGNMDAALNALTHVTQIHPNLNRPWYYLGYIEQLKGNGEAMQEYYKKSLFLSPFDHLPLYAFASYYKETGNISKSESYSKSAERAWKNKRSVHSIRCRWMYYENTEKDDVVPQGLLYYISPVFQTETDDTN
jgi:tetratricopeptide (TPR) repeat protein